MSNPIDFGRNVLALVTGASQGIGRYLAIEIARQFKNRVTLILVARSESGLKETEVLCKAVNPAVVVKLAALDLTRPQITDYERLLDDNLTNDGDLQSAIVFHNVGQVGALKPAVDLNDAKVWNDYYHLNVFSVAVLNSVFVKKIRANGPDTKIYAVNVTSLCGRQPFKDMALYGSGKAARELYFRVFAEEEPQIVVLNYSPGPVDTQMIAEVIDNMSNPEMLAVFVGMKEKNNILTPESTVQKLFGILQVGDFKSGDTVDYFDRI